MSSAAQFTANAQNAQSSTGPRTEAGKATSSLNAMKHGLTAATVLLPGEDEAQYLAHKQQYFDLWKPANIIETDYLQQIVDLQWRIKRCARLEAAALSKDEPDIKTLDTVSKHEVRLKKLFSETMKQLQEHITRRLETRESDKQRAAVIRKADKLKGRPTDLAKFGFDFSIAEIDRLIDYDDTLRRAGEVLNVQNQWRQ